MLEHDLLGPQERLRDYEIQLLLLLILETFEKKMERCLIIRKKFNELSEGFLCAGEGICSKVEGTRPSAGPFSG